LPPIEDQIVSIDDFIRAWHYPTEALANATIIYKKKKEQAARQANILKTLL
jgi:hypothetical protein